MNDKYFIYYHKSYLLYLAYKYAKNMIRHHGPSIITEVIMNVI